MSDSLTVRFAGDPLVVRIGENTAIALNAAKAASEERAIAEAAASASASVAHYRKTLLSGVANYPIGETFTSDETGEMRAYRRIAAAPGYEDMGDSAAPLTRKTLQRVSALPHGQRVLNKIGNGQQDVNIVLLGDSTGDAVNEWFYRLPERLGPESPGHTFKHSSWDNAAGAYAGEATLQADTGPRTVKLWNASVAGSVASHHASDRFFAAVEQVNPDLIFLNYSHNGGLVALRQTNFFAGIAAQLAKRLPDVPVVLIGQNPTTDDQSMAAKNEVLRAFAARQGWGFIDVHAAFLQAGVPLATLMGDAVHPNTAGQTIWRDTVYTALFASKHAAGGATRQPSHVLATISTLADLQSWGKVNCTVSKNVAQWETGAYSIEISNVAPGVAYIHNTLFSGDDIKALRGGYFTLTARLRVPAGSLGTTGRIDLEDDAGTTQAVGVTTGDGFITFTCTRKISDAATFIKCYIYSSAEAGSATIQIDRAVMSLGIDPVDQIRPNSFAAKALAVVGGNNRAMAVFHNSASTSIGIRFLFNEDDDPATQYGSDQSADGFSAKLRNDAYNRVEMRASGGIRFGGGAAATDMGIDRQLGGIMRFSGADIYPDADGIRYFGAGGAQWRAAFLKDGLYVQNTLVVGPKGAAIANAAAAAAAPTQTEFNDLVGKVNAMLGLFRAGTTKIDP